MKNAKKSDIKEAVKQHYAELISKDRKEMVDCGCGPAAFLASTEEAQRSCCSAVSLDAISSTTGYAEAIGYDKTELSKLPREAVQNTFGCGAPLSYTEIKQGDVVLDLGAGAGLDILLTSKQVGKTGKAIGLDMTPEMIATAKKNAQKMEADNVEFKLGEMENMPIADNSVDWIISNCVINLSPDKLQVFKEAFRVLKSGGKMVVSDIVAEGLSEALRQDLSVWAGCVGGALSENEYLQAIEAAGFKEVERLNRAEIAAEYISHTHENFGARIASIKVKAVKP
ncbi:MAG: arsenite methyltransferase [bacterium]